MMISECLARVPGSVKSTEHRGVGGGDEYLANIVTVRSEGRGTPLRIRPSGWDVGCRALGVYAANLFSFRQLAGSTDPFVLLGLRRV